MKFFIKTYGCQMNSADSENMAGILESAGYTETDLPENADIILVNTCVVRQNAEDRAAGYIGSLKSLKKIKPDLKIAVCGCFVSEPNRNLPKKFKHVDLFIEPSSPEKLAAFLSHDIDLSVQHRRRETGQKRAGVGDVTAWVTIMKGCDNFCSYCVVPYVRGREYSRPIDEILTEIKQIDFNQYKEIFLLGQNVNSYKYGLANLLKAIEKEIGNWKLEIGNLPRVRFMTSHPRDMSDEIVNAVALLPHVCEFFHLPIQHGDDKMLAEMNRGYTIDYYLKLVDKIRSKIPNASITSDIIIGYPGETDGQFQNSCKIVEKVCFDAVNTAIYSHRPETVASKLPDDVPYDVKQARLSEIMKVVNAAALKNNEKLIGSTQEILVDCITQNKMRTSPRSHKLEHPSPFPMERGRGEVYVGRTRSNKTVKFLSSTNNLIGKLVDVKITLAKSWVLEGEVING